MIRRNSILHIEGRLYFGQKFIESFAKYQSQSFRLCSFDLARLRRIFAPRIKHMVFGCPLNQITTIFTGLRCVFDLVDPVVVQPTAKDTPMNLHEETGPLCSAF
jgi:hypothetical protein